ncbi:NgoPII family restriction endonuclease [Providencia rettgeri]
MSQNTLKAFHRLFDCVIDEFNEDYNVSNRVNQVGDALEKFVKDLYANSVGIGDARELHQRTFSYLGNSHNPPDAILKNSDAIEIKKIESPASAIALNSSHPKDYFYRDDPLITRACANSESSEWVKKDMLYVIGFIQQRTLKGLWFVYGDCYAADREVYKRIKDRMTGGIESLNLPLESTNEIAKVNGVDPLGITNLRVRGMWTIAHPSKVFSGLNLITTGCDFFAHLIMTKDKYDSFPSDDRALIEQDISQQNLPDVSMTKRNVEIYNPNNLARNINAVVVSLIK